MAVHQSPHSMAFCKAQTLTDMALGGASLLVYLLVVCLHLTVSSTIAGILSVLFTKAHIVHVQQVLVR